MTMSSIDFGPRPHGVYSDRDRHGTPRMSVTRARRGRRGGGRPLKTLTGHDRNIAYPYLSHIYFDHTGKHFEFDEKLLADEYLTISEDVAIQMMLLMEAVRCEPIYNRAVAMAQAISAMNTCEAAWWYAHHKTPSQAAQGDAGSGTNARVMSRKRTRNRKVQDRIEVGVPSEQVG